MTALRGLLAALALAGLLCSGGAAFASGRAGPTPPNINAPSFQHGAPMIAGRAAWRGAQVTYAGGSALVAEAARYLGSGKFTGLPGAWCADAVSAWLRAIGKPPLANRMAASALFYGPHVAEPQPGDLVVMRTRRGYAGHVGVFVGFDAGGDVEIVSGNWGHRVARGVIPRRSVTAFVRA